MSAVLPDAPLEFRRDEYVLTTDRKRIPIDEALALLHTTFWAKTMPRDQLARAMQQSVCFGVLAGDTLVAFARAITDLATYAYLCDVVVDPPHGRKGLAQWIVRTMIEHPQMQGFRRFALITNNAHTLYAKFGFVEMNHSTYMELRPTREANP